MPRTKGSPNLKPAHLIDCHRTVRYARPNCGLEAPSGIRRVELFCDDISASLALERLIQALTEPKSKLRKPLYDLIGLSAPAKPKKAKAS